MKRSLGSSNFLEEISSLYHSVVFLYFFVLISVHFHGKTFNITVIQVYAPTTNAEKAEVEQFYDDLQDPLELTPKKKKKKDILFIKGDWNAKEGSQETPGLTSKFGLGIQNEVQQK